MLGGTAPAEKIGQLSRMDLGQKQVIELLPFLEYFARTGKLPAPGNPCRSDCKGHLRPGFQKQKNSCIYWLTVAGWNSRAT